jgi:biopolymer transport protein ExbD
VRLRRPRRNAVSLIDAAPMTDMVFQVLLFFIISSSFVVEPGIKIALPESKTAELQADKRVMITVDKDQKVFMDDRQIPVDELERQLKLRLPQYADRTVIIRADRSVPHGLVVRIMDAAKLAGATKLAIATERD